MITLLGIMALIRNPKATIIVGIIINIAFLILKFVIFIYSHVNLFFSDAIDSFADCFIIIVIVIFLRFNLNNKLTYLNMDIMFFSQWCTIIIFRIIIFLDQISDLVKPEARKQPLLIIIVSCIVIAGGVVLALLFVDEDDVVKFFISTEEKEMKKQYKAENEHVDERKTFTILPIFAEALDNLVTTAVALLVGILLYCNIIVTQLYLIDDISNMLISVVMTTIACTELWKLSNKYKNKSYFKPLFEIHLPLAPQLSPRAPSPNN